MTKFYGFFACGSCIEQNEKKPLWIIKYMYLYLWMILSCKLHKSPYLFFFQSVGNEDEAEDVTSIVETEVHVQWTNSSLCESSIDIMSFTFFELSDCIWICKK